MLVCLVSLDLARMNRTIGLDDQPSLGTAEVDDKRTNGMLPPELEPIELLST